MEAMEVMGCRGGGGVGEWLWVASVGAPKAAPVASHLLELARGASQCAPDPLALPTVPGLERAAS